MALALVESMDSMNPSKQIPFLGESYEFTLKQSIQNVLAEIRKGNLGFSQFKERFYELIQARADPPMESIWFYSALTFRSCSSTMNGDFLDRVAAMTVLFQLVCSCSAPCGSSKTIVLLSPVVYEVYKLIGDMLRKDLVSKREKKAMREVKALVEAILGFINLSSCKDSDQNGESLDFDLITPFVDLISIWTHPNDGLDQFLPLVSSDVRGEFCSGVCDVRRLAGVIIAETFLMKLCLDFNSGRSRQDLEKDLRTWTVGSITRIRNFYLFETLVIFLLEATLPVMSLLSTEDAALLRKFLYDALILVDYSFLNPEKAVNLPAEHVAFLAVKRLILTHEAVEFYREHGDQNRAISYLNAFSSSLVSSQIIKWVRSQIPSNENVDRPNGSSPKIFLEWLLKAEEQGARVFDDTISDCRAKLVIDISKSVSRYPTLEGNKVDDNLLFYIDKQGENENGSEEDKAMGESVNAALVTTMSTTDNGSGKQKRQRKRQRKRQSKGEREQGARVFDDTISDCRAKLVIDISKSVSRCPTLEGNKVDDNLLFYIDKQGENENGSEEDKAMGESVNAALVTTMSTTDNGSGKQKRQRKRQRKRQGKGEREQGAKVFDDTISDCRAKLVIDISKSVSRYPTLEGNKVDDNLLFYIDKQGENENGSEEDKAMGESVNAALVTTMSTTDNGSGKQKRQRKRQRRKNKKIKFIKYDLVPNSDAATAQSRSAVDNDDTNSEGEVHNPHSEDSDMEE